MKAILLLYSIKKSTSSGYKVIKWSAAEYSSEVHRRTLLLTRVNPGGELSGYILNMQGLSTVVNQ